MQTAQQTPESLRADQDYDYEWRLEHVATGKVLLELRGHWYFNGVGVTSAEGFASVEFSSDGTALETMRYTGTGQGDTEAGDRLVLKEVFDRDRGV